MLNEGFAVKGSGVRGTIWCQGVCIQQRGKYAVCLFADSSEPEKGAARAEPAPLTPGETQTLVPAGGSDAGGRRAPPRAAHVGTTDRGWRGRGAHTLGAAAEGGELQSQCSGQVRQVSVLGRDRLAVLSVCLRSVGSEFAVRQQGGDSKARETRPPPRNGGARGRRHTFTLKHGRS